MFISSLPTVKKSQVSKIDEAMLAGHVDVEVFKKSLQTAVDALDWQFTRTLTVRPSLRKIPVICTVKGEVHPKMIVSYLVVGVKSDGEGLRSMRKAVLGILAIESIAPTTHNDVLVVDSGAIVISHCKRIRSVQISF